MCRPGWSGEAALALVLIVLAISLIIDLDSPWVGSVHVPQAPMEHMAQQVVEMAAGLAIPSPPIRGER